MREIRVDGTVPVLIELARNNLHFDNWHCSMPGPTWPNRLVAEAISRPAVPRSRPKDETGSKAAICEN